MNRRSFLKTSAGAAALGLSMSGLQNIAVAATEKKIPISVQLYSVRDAAAKDLAKVLKGIAAIGYQGVEFAGYYGHEAKEIRKMLDDVGLKCSGTHTGLHALLGENFDKTVEIHKTLGTPFIIVPGGIDAALATKAGNEMTAFLFNELADKLNKLDMELGYHAHGGDFKKIDGETAWDRFFAKTRQNVFMQMDIGNCLDGGGDPYEPIKKFPGRSKAIHLKEWSDNGAPVGEGKVDWPRVFELCESVGGTEWYVVEHEVGDAVSLDGIEACVKNLRKMGK